MKRSAAFLSSVVGLSLLGGLAIAQESSPTPSATGSASPTPSASAGAVAPGVELATAMNFLHHTNVLEIGESNNALAKLSDPSAITLANTIISDHQSNEQQVVALAARKNITLYEFQPSTYEIAATNALSTLSGPTFDSTYKSHELEGHQAVLSQLQMMQSTVTDPDVKSLINSTIPVVQQHIQLAGATSQAGAQPSSSPQPTSSASPSPSVSPSASPSPGASLTG